MNFPPIGAPPGSAYSQDSAKDIASHIFDEYSKLRDRKPVTETPQATPNGHPAQVGGTPPDAGAAAVPSDYGMTVSYF